MNSFRGSRYAWPAICVLAAPLLLVVVALTIVTARLTRLIFGNDPATSLIDQHPEAWAISKLTGRCTLGLLFVALMLRDAS
jgi:hypothetical protein